jgi:hypothetical protein
MTINRATIVAVAFAVVAALHVAEDLKPKPWYDLSRLDTAVEQSMNWVMDKRDAFADMW